MAKACADLRKVVHRSRHPAPSGHGCVECLRSRDEWVHLRLCLSCGHVGCCDESPNRHAAQHFRETGHRVIKAFEPDEDWAYCWEHQDVLPEIDAFPDESPPEHYAPP